MGPSRDTQAVDPRPRDDDRQESEGSPSSFTANFHPSDRFDSLSISDDSDAIRSVKEKVLLTEGEEIGEVQADMLGSYTGPFASVDGRRRVYADFTRNGSLLRQTAHPNPSAPGHSSGLRRSDIIYSEAYKGLTENQEKRTVFRRERQTGRLARVRPEWSNLTFRQAMEIARQNEASNKHRKIVKKIQQARAHRMEATLRVQQSRVTSTPEILKVTFRSNVNTSVRATAGSDSEIGAPRPPRSQVSIERPNKRERSSSPPAHPTPKRRTVNPQECDVGMAPARQPEDTNEPLQQEQRPADPCSRCTRFDLECRAPLIGGHGQPRICVECRSAHAKCDVKRTADGILITAASGTATTRAHSGLRTTLVTRISTPVLMRNTGDVQPRPTGSTTGPLMSPVPSSIQPSESRSLGTSTAPGPTTSESVVGHLSTGGIGPLPGGISATVRSTERIALKFENGITAENVLDRARAFHDRLTRSSPAMDQLKFEISDIQRRGGGDPDARAELAYRMVRQGMHDFDMALQALGVDSETGRPSIRML